MKDRVINVRINVDTNGYSTKTRIWIFKTN